MLRIILFNIFLISFGINALAQSDLLKKLQDKFDSISNFSADFTQKLNDRVNLTGKIFFKKENKLKLETENIIIISDGETVWNYNKKQNKVIVSLYDESDPAVLSLNKMIYGYPDECEVTELIRQDSSILIFVPKENSALNFDTAKLYLNNKNLIKKVEIRGLSNGLIKIEFSNYELNQKLPDSKFSFTPPEGSSIIDLR